MRVAVAVVAFGLLAGQAQSAGLAKSGFIERVMTIKNTNASGTETLKTYWEGDNMRMEQYGVGGLEVRIKKGSALYVYIPSQKKAVKTIVPPEYRQTVQQMLEEMSGPVKGGKKVGAAKVAGVNCNVYMVSEGGGSAKAYVSADSRLPTVLKMVTTMGSMTQTMETMQLKLNYNVPDTMFTIPKGVEVKEEKFPEIPKQPAAGSQK